MQNNKINLINSSDIYDISNFINEVKKDYIKVKDENTLSMGIFGYLNNVFSIDFTSSYPAVMLSEKYPMSKAFSVDLKDEKDFRDCLNAFCCMFDCKFYNLTAKVEFENYVSISRCRDIKNYIVLSRTSL